MKKLQLTLMLLCVLVFQACDEDRNCEPATGAVTEEELFLDPFTDISLAISADVYITKGAEQQVIVEAQSSIIDLLLQTSVTDGIWDIAPEQCFNTNEPVSIFITLPALEEVSISGSGDVVVEDSFTTSNVSLRTAGSGSIRGKFEATTMDCAISGSGGITVEGTAQAADIRISGSGSVAAFGLQTTTCQVSISGSGSVEVNVSESLDVSIAGSGSVRYKGNPDISSSISGSGQVVDAN